MRQDLTTIEVKTPGPWRALEVLGGLVVVVLAAFVLADPQFAVQTLVIVIAAGLLIGGLFRIGLGLFAVVLPSRMRSLNTVGGVIAVILGIVALLDLQAAISTLILLLAIALLLVGGVEIGVGFARHPPAWLRGLIIVIGVLTVILSVLVIFDTALGQGILAAILALASSPGGGSKHHSRSYRSPAPPSHCRTHDNRGMINRSRMIR